ncbi:hypothetical protein H4R34_001220 [Dimargaris verticillata]|uniref:Uncharacterized protein n=1 Tax=Dimargaris verticillata TaxID=2761393 RepID=A0A9W8EF69_9FUNG|nr:hypothetical protein H4R34_001220 [Dimargaris verticillata]
MASTSSQQTRAKQSVSRPLPSPKATETAPTISILPEWVQTPAEFLCLETAPPVFRDPFTNALLNPVQACVQWAHMSLEIFHSLSLVGFGTEITTFSMDQGTPNPRAGLQVKIARSPPTTKAA